MGLIIQLEDENGHALESLAEQGGSIREVLPAPMESDYRCLCFIDPYGDTTFNRLQMQDFIAEWKGLFASAVNDAEKGSVHAEVLELAERCASGPHLYLKFYGD